MRSYVQPRIPSDWHGPARTYGNMINQVLDDLHMPIKESWLSKELSEKINSAPTAALINYTDEAQDTGVKWLDGSPIKRITLEISVTANTEAESAEVENLGTVIRVEGAVVTSAGACYPIGTNGSVSVSVWRPATGSKVKALSSVAGTAYVTVYYLEGEAPVSSDTYVYFDNGYTDYTGGGQIAWGANQLTRPSDWDHGYSSPSAIASLDYVASEGYMLLRVSNLNSSPYNCHVCTANLAEIPSDATKLTVTAARGSGTSRLNIALLPTDAADSMDTSQGGKISPWYTPSNDYADYSLMLDAGMAGSSDYRIVVNMKATGESNKYIRITNVRFE